MDQPLLAAVPEQERALLLRSLRRRRFARREVLFHEGDLADSLHLVDTGRIAVRMTTRFGDVATVNVLGPGQVLGELALLSESRRLASAVAIDAVQTLTIDRDRFRELRVAHPGIERFLTEALAQSVRRVSAQLVEALFVDAETRVRRRILELHATFGGHAVPMTQEDLASMAGTSRATANRVLRDLEQHDLVTVSRGRFSVTDAEGLRARAR